MMKSFQQTQYAFAAHLRSPDSAPAPDAIEERRIAIYRDLIYNNIEGFIAGAFPVLRRLYSDTLWHAMVRDFIEKHQAHTPYFLEISQEFLAYLWQERGVVDGDPPFLLELAHYEWVELALDVAEGELLESRAEPQDLMSSFPRVSPLVMNLAYQYPVHKISPGFLPKVPALTYLVVYRNAQDEVKFMESNALTHRLLYLLQEQPARTLMAVLEQIAKELDHPEFERLLADGISLVQELYRITVISHFE
jgi:uncharacterized protein